MATGKQEAHFETCVREGFLNGEHVVSVYFDLEKTYDITWKYEILKDFYNMDLRGRLTFLFRSFYQNENLQ